jgi:predicted amidophosphoribosyltransferase
VKEIFKKIQQEFLDMLFPTTCVSCGTGREVICASCFRQIPLQVFCESNNLSVYSYHNELVNKLLWKLKYEHSGDVAKKFSKTVADEFLKLLANRFVTTDKHVKNIYLLPIPLSHNDKRLHNHAELIAVSLQERLQGFTFNTKVLGQIFEKTTKIKQAHLQNRSERFENIKGKIKLNTKAIPEKTNPNDIFVIVDDITTTGATLGESKSILLQNSKINPQNVFGLTIAH